MNTILAPTQLAEEGRALYGRGDYAGAAGRFEQAAEGYRLAGEAVLAAEMANNVSVARLQAKDAAGALAAVEGTAAVFEQAGERLKLAMAYGNRAAALDGLGKLAEAEADYERSSALLKELGEHELRADVMKALTALQIRSGRNLEALASMDIGLAGVKNLSLKHRFLQKILGFVRKNLKIG